MLVSSRIAMPLEIPAFAGMDDGRIDRGDAQSPHSRPIWRA